MLRKWQDIIFLESPEFMSIDLIPILKYHNYYLLIRECEGFDALQSVEGHQNLHML